MSLDYRKYAYKYIIRTITKETFVCLLCTEIGKLL
jgi:hypothetical protein